MFGHSSRQSSRNGSTRSTRSTTSNRPGRGMGHSSSAPALRQTRSRRPSRRQRTPIPEPEPEPEGYPIVHPFIPGMDSRGFINNRAYPMDPISGDPLVTMDVHKELYQEEEKSRWAFTGVQKGGYGNCYPGDPSGLVPFHGADGSYMPPAKILPQKRDYDIVTGRYSRIRGPGQKANWMSETGSLPPVLSQGLRPPLRDVSILSWKDQTTSKFGDSMQHDDGPNPARQHAHIPKHTYRLADKIGGADLTLQTPAEGMYAVANKVGGDRATDFVRRNAERRQQKRDTTTKPHVSYG